MNFNQACWAFAVGMVIACQSPLTAKDVAKDVLTGSQVLCILATGLVDAPAVVKACELDTALVPAVTQFLGDAKKLGVGRLPGK